MIPIIALLVGSTILIAAAVLVPHLLPRRLTFDAAPDPRSPFGNEMSWIAVRTEDGAAIVAALGLTEVRSANWSAGIGTIYDARLGDAHVFVTPPVNGWTLIAGVALPMPAGPAYVDKHSRLLGELSHRFGDAQYFATFPIIDFHAWGKYQSGRAVRIFAIGDDGVVRNSGKVVTVERQLGLRFVEVRGIKARSGDIGGELLLHPTEEHVLRIAAAWSLDPTAAATSSETPAAGWIARVPPAWRAERVRKAA